MHEAFQINHVDSIKVGQVLVISFRYDRLIVSAKHTNETYLTIH